MKLTATQIADAIEACDWSGSSIGNKSILKAAVTHLRGAAKRKRSKTTK